MPARKLIPCLLLSVLAWTQPPASAADAPDKSKQAVIKSADADADFALQGEYAGEFTRDGETMKLGVQIIALGDGKFRAVGFPGGLPGDGSDPDKKVETENTTRDGKIAFVGEHAVGILESDGLHIESNDGQAITTIKKVERKSPTLGKKPPEGAVVLFDGKSADAFDGGKLVDENLLAQGMTSKAKFQDCTVHLEFLLSYMPHARGQGRSNSGCYLQGRYEVQILDSFGLQGLNNECGGIYEVSDPKVNMCYPPLTWQTYDIDFTAAKYEGGKKTADAKITVKHNGVVVQKDVEIPKSTRAAPVKEGPEPGPLYIQDHGNPLRFRNIWVLEKK